MAGGSDVSVRRSSASKVEVRTRISSPNKDGYRPISGRIFRKLQGNRGMKKKTHSGAVGGHT